MERIELNRSWVSADSVDNLVDHSRRVSFTRALSYLGEPVPSLAKSENRQRASDIADGAPGEAYIRCAAAAESLSGDVAPYYMASAGLWARNETTRYGRSREETTDDIECPPTAGSAYRYDIGRAVPESLADVATSLSCGLSHRDIAEQLAIGKTTVTRKVAMLRSILPNPQSLLGGAYYGLLAVLHDDRPVDCS